MTANIEQQIRSVCAEYVEAHGNDLETPDYLRLTARVWEILGRMSQPYMGPVDEVIGYLEEEAEVDRGNRCPGGWPVSHPEYGPAISVWRDINGADIRAAMVHIVGQVPA